MYVASFLQLRTTNKSKNIQNKKSQKNSILLTFIDFYSLINTKFWFTNEKDVYKKSLLVMYISLFLQL